MRREPSFGDLLDQQLAGVFSQGANPEVATGFGFSTPPLFSLDPQFAFTAGRLSPRAGIRLTGEAGMAYAAGIGSRPVSRRARQQPNPYAQYAQAAPATSSPTVVSRRPRRALSVREQRAFADLIRLGAHLDQDFSNAELRSAFRLLARRYHPDRHPSSSPAERTELASTFAQVRQAYADLQSAAAL